MPYIASTIVSKDLTPSPYPTPGCIILAIPRFNNLPNSAVLSTLP